ncbi:MAG: hypothetical protein HKN87_03295 [Saprospiraceae bacterium]|nr:hypothetical protein [Saprospiraceae bacterium]
MWSIVSVAGVLFLLGVFGFISLHSNDIVDNLKEDFQVVVELKSEISSKEVDDISAFLQKDVDVLGSSVKFVSKEVGLKQLAAELGDDVLSMDMPNPLSDVYTFGLIADRFNSETFRALQERLSAKFNDIAGIYYDQGFVEQVAANLEKMSYALLVGGLILAILALTLIYNSIRLSLYANRFLVKNMELVGASWSFIRRPFVWKGVRHGLFSALTAICAMCLVGYLVFEQVPELMQYLNIQYLVYLVIMTIAAGVLINLISTFFIVTRFLKMNVNDLH